MEVKPLHVYHKPKGMSQSRSESHIDYRPPPASIHSHYQHEARDEFKDQTNFGGGFYSPPLSSPVRGRSIRRTPSPTKLPPGANTASPTRLDDIKEDSPADSLLSPTKRSRSPVKQLFGEHGWLGKSTSMKELPSEQYRKTGIKHWSGKLKQRVGEMVRIYSPPSSASLGNPDPTRLTRSPLPDRRCVQKAAPGPFTPTHPFPSTERRARHGYFALQRTIQDQIPRLALAARASSALLRS